MFVCLEVWQNISIFWQKCTFSSSYLVEIIVKAIVWREKCFVFTNIFVWDKDSLNPEFHKKQSHPLRANQILSFSFNRTLMKFKQLFTLKLLVGTSAHFRHYFWFFSQVAGLFSLYKILDLSFPYPRQKYL